jgi:hypothetical protein
MLVRSIIQSLRAFHWAKIACGFVELWLAFLALAILQKSWILNARSQSKILPKINGQSSKMYPKYAIICPTSFPKSASNYSKINENAHWRLCLAKFWKSL